MATWLEKGYVNDPLVTFIIQSHNKSTQVKHVVDKLRTYSKAEIIVIDDGADFSHHVSLMKYLDRGNEFLLRANDLYENVMYDKTIRLANGRYLALLQDDDDFNDLSWVDEAVAYFQRYPGLAILGGRDLLDFAIDKENHRFDILIQEPEAEEKFRFVAHVNRAPMWINKKLFLDRLAHIDFDFAPFQFDDVELCLRAWLKGCQVAWYHSCDNNKAIRMDELEQILLNAINDLLDNYYDETNLQNLYNQTNKQNTNDETINILKKEKNNLEKKINDNKN